MADASLTLNGHARLDCPARRVVTLVQLLLCIANDRNVELLEASEMILIRNHCKYTPQYRLST